jgi:hypothetical protein
MINQATDLQDAKDLTPERRRRERGVLTTTGQIGTGKRPGHGAESGASALHLLGADVQRLLRAGHHVIGVRAGRVMTPTGDSGSCWLEAFDRSASLRTSYDVLKLG